MKGRGDTPHQKGKRDTPQGLCGEGGTYHRDAPQGLCGEGGTYHRDALQGLCDTATGFVWGRGDIPQGRATGFVRHCHRVCVGKGGHTTGTRYRVCATLPQGLCGEGGTRHSLFFTHVRIITSDILS